MGQNSAKLTPAQQKQRSELIKKGLYHPKNPRKKPTKYVFSLFNKFADVLSGNASVINVKPPKIKGKRQTKGVKLAHEIAGENSRVVGNKIIVPVRKSLGEHAVLNKKTQTIDIVRNTSGGTYRRKLMRKRIKSAADIPMIDPETQTFSVPFYRGKGRPVDFVNMTREELIDFFTSYGPSAGKREFEGLGKLIQISTFDKAPEFEDDEELSFHQQLEERGETPSAKRKRRKRARK